MAKKLIEPRRPSRASGISTSTGRAKASSSSSEGGAGLSRSPV